MTAKEYLARIRTLDIKINQKTKEISALKTTLTDISAVSMSDDKVRDGSIPGDARFVITLAKIDKLERELDAEIDKFVDTRHGIISDIQSLDNPLYIKILFKRFVEYKTFDDIANDIHYSNRQTMRFYNQALNEFTKEVM